MVRPGSCLSGQACAKGANVIGWLTGNISFAIYGSAWRSH
jgi:hypothetical protein